MWFSVTGRALTFVRKKCFLLKFSLILTRKLHCQKEITDQYFLELQAEDDSTGCPQIISFFRGGVAIFGLFFLSHFFTKTGSFEQSLYTVFNLLTAYKHQNNL